MYVAFKKSISFYIVQFLTAMAVFREKNVGPAENPWMMHNDFFFGPTSPFKSTCMSIEYFEKCF